MLAFYMASLGDFSMAEAFKAGKDLHEESAVAALGKELPLTDEERQVGKTFNYATTYGQGVAKCALVLGCSYEAAERMLQLFHTRWPGIKLLHNIKRGETPGAIQGRLGSRGYISTLHGRRLKPHLPHKSLNTLVQGSAADLLRCSLVKVAEWLKEENLKSHIVNAVHDEIQIDVVKEETPVIARTVPALMSNACVEQYVPVAVETEVSYETWADKEPYNPARLQ